MTPPQIDRQSNAEIRRILLERYGVVAYLQQSGASVRHQDDYGTLYWRPGRRGEEPLVALVVTNSTAEPDGSRKQYMLRVPPHMQTAREAVAWTAGLGMDEYNIWAES